MDENGTPPTCNGCGQPLARLREIPTEELSDVLNDLARLVGNYLQDRFPVGAAFILMIGDGGYRGMVSSIGGHDKILDVLRRVIEGVESTPEGWS